MKDIYTLLAKAQAEITSPGNKQPNHTGKGRRNSPQFLAFTRRSKTPSIEDAVRNDRWLMAIAAFNNTEYGNDYLSL